jgi:PEP-CTERM motif
MRTFALRFATTLLFACAVAPAYAGNIYGISYTDISPNSSTNLTTAGTLDWVKWGNGDATGTVNYTTSQMTAGAIINPALTPIGTVPQGQTVELAAFAPSPPPTSTPSFSWTNGSNPEFGGVPVSTSVSEQIAPAQFSYPLGLGLSFQVAASAIPEELSLYVVGFNSRMEVSATLSGGGSDSLIASTAALNLVPSGAGNNDFSYGIFSIVYSGAGETLTIDLTAANQSGISTGAPQFSFPNAGVYAATVTTASVPEPSSLVLSAIGLGGLLGYGFVRRRTR